MKKVNEVSRLAGVSKRTLQFYDDEGLLPAQRSKDNYRLYDDAALERLWEILVYRAMGLDLKEIKDLLTLSEKQKISIWKRKFEGSGNRSDSLTDRWNLFHMCSKMECYRFRQRKTLWKRPIWII